MCEISNVVSASSWMTQFPLPDWNAMLSGMLMPALVPPIAPGGACRDVAGRPTREAALVPGTSPAGLAEFVFEVDGEKTHP